MSKTSIKVRGGAEGALRARWGGSMTRHPCLASGFPAQLDPQTPLIWEVWNMDKKVYLEAIHTPQTMQEPARFSYTNFCEFFSRTVRPWAGREPHRPRVHHPAAF